jgi:type I restriction enzyme S subunit
MSETKVMKLSEVCRVYQPETISKKSLPIGGTFPVYGANGKIGFNDKYNHEDPQLLLGCRGSVGSIHISEPFSWINGNAMVVQPFETIVTRDYMKYALLGGINIKSAISGTAQPQITRESLSPIQIPVPSLEKQREIVEKLDNAFAEIDLLEENLGFRILATEKLQASLLASFFDLDEDEVTNDYSFHSLGSVSVVKGGKRLPKGTKWSPTSTKYPYIRVTDMKLGRINEDNLVFVPDEIRPLIKNYTVNSGDIIISIAGTIGEIAVVPESLDKASLTENAAKIILQKEKLNSDYCSYFLRSPVCRREIDSLVRTTTQPKLALFRIESLRIPIPPIVRQLEIVNILHNGFSEIEALRLRFKMEKNLTVSLRQSFLSSAFTPEEAVA